MLLNAFALPSIRRLHWLRYAVLGFLFFLAEGLLAQLAVDFSAAGGLNNPNGEGRVVCEAGQISFFQEATFNGVPVNSNDPDYEFSWSFSTGNSSLPDPKIPYGTVGSTGVTLTVTKISTGETVTIAKPGFITVVKKPVANFTFAPEVACIPFSVRINTDPSTVSGDRAQARFETTILGEGSALGENPTLSVNSPGDKSLALIVTDEFGCTADTSFINKITAKAKPNPNFSGTGLRACEPPLDFTLNAAETGDFNFDWTIPGIVGPFNGRSVSGTVTNPGVYDVILNISGGQGCDTSLTKSEYIVVQDVEALFNAPDTVCRNDRVSFSFTGQAVSGDSYDWNFGDGGPGSNNANPQRTLQNFGDLDVCLTVTSADGSCTDTYCKTIHVVEVDAQFSLSDRTSCKVPHTVSFDPSGSTFPPGTQFQWTTDGNTFASPNNYTYNSFGNYNVRLRLITPQGCVSTKNSNPDVQIRRLNIQAFPDKFDGCTDQNWTYTDGSNYGGEVVATRTWTTTWLDQASVVDVGNSGIANTYNYFVPLNDHGSYLVNLRVETESGCEAETSFNYEAGLKPVADFDVFPLDTCANDTTFFNDSSYVLLNGMKDRTLIDEWEWSEYPEGPTSEQFPKVKFRQNGIDTLNPADPDVPYDLQLVVGYNGCYDTLLKEDHFTKWGPVIDGLSIGRPCNSDSIFIHGNMFTWTSREWYIQGEDGDGNVIDTVITDVFPSNQDTVYNGQDVDVDIHSQVDATRDTLFFPAPNGFRGTAKVILYNNAYASCDSCWYDVETSLFDDIIPIDFFLPNALCLANSGNGTTITATAQNTTEAYRWTRTINGDTKVVGNPNTSLNFEPDMGAGDYRICLEQRWNQDCPIRVCKDITLSAPEVEIQLEGGNFQGCSDLAVDLRANPTAGNNFNLWTWQWNVIDSTDAANPSIIKTFNTQDPDTFLFKGAGDYFFQLIATDDNGCSTEANFGQQVTVNDPIANFQLNDGDICAGDSLELTNLSVFDEPLSYQWFLDTVLVSQDSVPDVDVFTVDTLDITLIASTNICADTLVRSNVLQVDPIPDFDFDATVKSGTCPPLSTKLYPIQNSEDFDGYSFEWDYDLGTSVLSDSVPVVFPEPGNYDVTLTVTTPNGCESTITQPGFINLIGPSADDIRVSKDPVCVNEPVTFTVVNPVDVDIYEWSFGDFKGDTKAPPEDSVTHIYQAGSATPYEVLLDYSNANCERRIKTTVFVNELTAIIDGPDPDTVCFDGTNGTLSFEDVSTGSVASFLWELPDGSTNSTDSVVSYTAQGAMQDTVFLEVIDPASGCSDKDTSLFWVFDPPVMDPPQDTILCQGDPDLELTVSSQDTDNHQYFWLPQNGSIRTSNADSSQITVNPGVTTTYTIIDTNLRTTCSAFANVTVSRDFTNIGFELTYNDTCNNSQVAIDYPNDTVARVFNWSIKEYLKADTNFFNSDISQYDINNPDTVDFILSAYDLSPRCAQDTMTRVVVYPNPEPEILPDSVLCYGETIVLESSGGDTIVWSVDNPVVPVPVGYNPDIQPLDDVRYTMDVTSNYIFEGNLVTCEGQAAVTIEVDSAVAGMQLDSLEACGFGEVALVDTGYFGQKYFLDWGDGSAQVTGQFPPDTSFYSYPSPGFYDVEFIARDNTMGALHCQDTLRWSFEVFERPTATASTEKDLICNYETVALTATGGVQYEWDNPETLTDTSVFNPGAFPDFFTKYTVIVTDARGCKDTADVDVDVVPEYVIDPKQENDTVFIGRTGFVYFESVDSLTGAPYDVDISWDNDYAMGCNDCDSTSGQMLRTANYTITTIDQPNQCYEKQFSFEIHVIEKYVLDVPNAFSPNNDGRNDVVFVRGIGVQELLYFQIYNRWGELVYEGNDMREGWDGVYKGKVQNDETFVYKAAVLYYNGTTEEKSGYLNIVR